MESRRSSKKWRGLSIENVVNLKTSRKSSYVVMFLFNFNLNVLLKQGQ